MRSNSAAEIASNSGRSARFRSNDHLQRTAGGHRVQGVQQQVDHHLADLLGIGLQSDRFGRRGEPDGYLLLVRSRPGQAKGVTNDGGKIARHP